MGTAWQYQPQNEVYKSGGQLISLLVETRAKGGNLLLNIGPKPDGELPIEQEERLRELALWMFVNSEAIYGVRPWVITNEQDIWFTKKKDADTLYVVVKQQERWKRGAWKDIVLHSVKATRRDPGERAGAERPGPRIPAGGRSQDHLEAGGRRPAHPRHVRPALAGQQQVAEPRRPEDHERQARAHAAARAHRRRQMERHDCDFLEAS